MNQNRSELTKDKQFVQKIKDIERELVALKTRQPIGADNIEMAVTPLYPLDVTVAAGGVVHVPLPFTATIHDFYVSELSLSYFVDTEDAGHLAPSGADLSAGQLKHVVSVRYDGIGSSEVVNGRKLYVATVANLDSASHTFLLRYALTLPTGSVTSTVVS